MDFGSRTLTPTIIEHDYLQVKILIVRTQQIVSKYVYIIINVFLRVYLPFIGHGLYTMVPDICRGSGSFEKRELSIRKVNL